MTNHQSTPSLIIGIDPGSRMTGYGIIKSDGNQLSFIDAGTIKTDSKDMPTRIAQIFEGIYRIVEHHKQYKNYPMMAAIEEVFMAQNPDSALKLGQARGAAIAALTFCELSVAEYTARQIKQSVCGYGAADKTQILAMVQRLLNLDFMPQVDAGDGLACAICHAYNSHSMQKILGASRATSKKKGRWRLSDEDILAIKSSRS